jgi:hypothetical protein
VTDKNKIKGVHLLATKFTIKNLLSLGNIFNMKICRKYSSFEQLLGQLVCTTRNTERVQDVEESFQNIIQEVNFYYAYSFSFFIALKDIRKINNQRERQRKEEIVS